jgi:hypothetical protein
MNRRAALGTLLVSAFTAAGVEAQVEAEAVPLELQVQLLQKIVRYDQNFLRRASGLVRTLLVVDGKQPDSTRAGQTARALLREQKDIGGLPHEEQIVAYTDAPSVRRAVESGRFGIVYLMRGIGRSARDIAAALSGADVLSVSAVPGHVPEGVVLGFDLVSSQPKLLTNLTAASKQGVAFQAQAIKLMKVYR